MALSLVTISTNATTSASVLAAVGNEYFDPVVHSSSLYLLPLVERYTSGSTSISTGPFTASFSGLSASGSFEVEKFTARATAQAEYGALRVSANYTLTNALAGNNSAYVNQDFTANESGVPSGFQALASARVSDSVLVAAAAPLDHVTFTYRLNGIITNSGGPVIQYSGPNNYVSIYQTGIGIYESPYSGSFDELVSFSVKLNAAGIAKYRLEFAATSGLYSVFSMFGRGTRDSSGNVDFLNSLSLLSLKGYSASGTQVGLVSAIGSEGVNYLALAVPEPSTWILCALGLIAVAIRVNRATSVS